VTVVLILVEPCVPNMTATVITAATAARDTRTAITTMTFGLLYCANGAGCACGPGGPDGSGDGERGGADGLMSSGVSIGDELNLPKNSIK